MFISLQKLLPQHLLSRLVGAVANCQVGWVKNAFIRFVMMRYEVDMSEARESNIEAYPSFNAFFARQLKSGVRPISGDLCSPADGIVSASGLIDGNMIYQAKGISYSLTKLLAKSDVSDYSNGSFITVYLAPKDYHRVHCPATATLFHARYVPGKLFSVNQATTSGLADLFTNNERLVMEFDTDIGKMAVVMIGAMIVAAIQPTWRTEPYKANTLSEEFFDPARTFGMGAELGQFQMGSTAIVLLQKKVEWLKTSLDPVKMGEAIFTAKT